MCGIGGIAGVFDKASLVDSCQVLLKELRHRGPDDQGAYLREEQQCPIGLVHARLSILDLSPTGHQPMHSADGRFTIVFNGEIYNFAESRKKLLGAGMQLRSTGDTEVVLELYAKMGAACLDELAGMFAFAIWDRDRNELFLARDSLGIKPLYVWQNDGRIAFASELRALTATGLIARKLNSQALGSYLLMGSVQEPETLVEGVQMLPAGTSLTWRDGCSRTNTFWSLGFPEQTAYSSRARDRVSTFQESVGIAREALHETVARHFVSDVPVGIFLSGGIDSTALVALARQHGVKDIKTFSISFDEAEFNEGDLAARTAKHFKTEHHEWRMTSSEGQSLMNGFLSSMDQPSNDGFNTYCVSKFAHDQGMKVVLSGLGGDELFASYPSFQQIPRMMAYHKRVGALRQGLAWTMRRIWPTGPKARLSEYLRSSGDVEAAYCAFRGSFLMDETRLLVAHYTGQKTDSSWEQISDNITQQHWTVGDKISYLELTRYMRNQLLRDSDVMSMAWGLELRVPFVDQLLVDCLTKLPSSHRLAAGKRLLVEAVGDIPQWIIRQPKRGFRFPFQQWLAADESWSERFQATLAELPVRPKLWYQQWMLAMLSEAMNARG